MSEQKDNFEPTYYQVIEKNIKEDNPNEKYTTKLIKHNKKIRRIV